MSEIGALALAKVRSLGHRLAGVRHESRLKVAFVAVGITGLWLVAFAATWGAFRFVDRYGTELLGGAPLSLVELLLPRLIAVLALVLLVMLTFSSALLAYSTLYRSREVAYLLTTPASLRAVVLSRFVEVAFFASWASAFLGSPVVVAYGLVRHAPWPFYVAAAAAFVPFVTIPAAAGTAAAMAAARVLPRLPRWALPGGGAALLAAAYALFRARIGDSALREAVDVTTLLALSGRAENPWLPSFWACEGVLAAARGDGQEATFLLLLLLANAALAVLLVAELAQRGLYAGWERVASASRPGRERRGLGLLERALAPVPSATRALLVKDVRVFLRDPAQWAQALVFFGVLALYVANLKVPVRGYGAEFWRSFITLLNTVASLLVLATLTTRFVFPLVSLEGRRFWILGLAPLSVRQLLAEKLLLAATTTATVTGTVALLSAWRLRLPPGQLVFSVATVLLASVALSALAVGLGSLYPDFEAENPSRIVSGLGGTLTFLLSLAYVVAVGIAETVVLQWPHVGRHLGGPRAYPRALLLASASIVAVSAVAAWLPMRLGLSNLERVEH